MGYAGKGRAAEPAKDKKSEKGVKKGGKEAISIFFITKRMPNNNDVPSTTYYWVWSIARHGCTKMSTKFVDILSSSDFTEKCALCTCCARCAHAVQTLPLSMMAPRYRRFRILWSIDAQRGGG